jgi:hypothetical protein
MHPPKIATNLPTLIQTRRKQHKTHEQCSVFSTHHLGEHHHQNYAAGTGHKSALIFIIIIRQQDQALRLPNHFTLHHITNLDLATKKLGQQDQAIRLSKALGKPPFGIAVGKP